MTQKTPFLLTAATRTLKLKDVYKMGEQKAWKQFVAISIAFSTSCAVVAVRVRSVSHIMRRTCPRLNRHSVGRGGRAGLHPNTDSAPSMASSSARARSMLA